jgi:hypothetical protein
VCGRGRGLNRPRRRKSSLAQPWIKNITFTCPRQLPDGRCLVLPGTTKSMYRGTIFFASPPGHNKPAGTGRRCQCVCDLTSFRARRFCGGTHDVVIARILPTVTGGIFPGWVKTTEQKCVCSLAVHSIFYSTLTVFEIRTTF